MSGAIATAYSNRFGGQPNYTPTTSLTTPTFEGSGETTEPTWRTKPSWVTAVCTDLLAHNPLPSGDANYEDPSLLISNDNGTTWTTPAGLTNPISRKQTLAATNSDCFLLIDPNANRLIMLWCGGNDPTVISGVDQRGIWYSICTDPALVTWSAKTLLFPISGGTYNIIPGENEPKFLWNPVRSRFWMWTHDDNTGALRWRESLTTDPVGAYTAPTVCSLPIPGGDVFWHMDIIRETSGRFVMVLCDSHINGVMQRQGWLASSFDGIVWKVAPRPFMKANAWAVSGVYRPSIIRARDGSDSWDLITSRHQTPTARLGLVRNIPKTEIP